MRRLTATLVVFVLAGATALAQSPPVPDFSGEWVLDLERTRAANGNTGKPVTSRPYFR